MPKAFLISEDDLRRFRRVANEWDKLDVRVVFEPGAPTVLKKSELRSVLQIGVSSAASVPEPFDVTDVTDNGDDTSNLTIQPGTVNNLIPSNMFDTHAVPNTGTRYLVLDVTTSASGVVTACALSVDTTAPDAVSVAEAAPPTTLSILLAVIVDAVAYQIRSGNVAMTVEQAFLVDKDPPGEPGTLSYVPWYTWALA